MHAIIDAILGAKREKDIGTYFPNYKKFKNIRSPKMLKPIINNLDQSNFSINNLDINLMHKSLESISLKLKRKK